MTETIYFGHDEHVRESSCPVCAHKLDATTALSREPGDHRAKDGDYSICLYCATVLRFELGLNPREATRDDLTELRDRDYDKFRLLQRAVSAAQRRIWEARQRKYWSN